MVAPTLQAVDPNHASPFEEGARSAEQACRLLQLYGVDINLVTLRWFQNIGLIDKPAKEGRNAVYSRAVLDEVASIRMLQGLYGRSIDELRSLRERRVGFAATLKHLLRLESRIPRRGAFMKGIEPFTWPHSIGRMGVVSEFFVRVVEDGVHPGRLVHRPPAGLIFDARPQAR